jgi:small subunit ribosomal protein S6
MERQYETVFITTPVLSEDQMKETVEKFRNILRKNQAEVVHEENWGLRKLAYPIDKKSTGFYHLIEFKAEGDTVDNLEVEFKRDERIIRFLTVKMDKYAIEYAEKRRDQKSTNTQTPEPQKEE